MTGIDIGGISGTRCTCVGSTCTGVSGGSVGNTPSPESWGNAVSIDEYVCVYINSMSMHCMWRVCVHREWVSGVTDRQTD